MDEELRSELLAMVAIDQDLRNRALEDIGNAGLVARIAEADERHTARLRQVIDTLGRWPGAGMVGEDGAHAAWLLVQHADRDPEFQRRCLDLMGAAGDAEVEAKNLAYLTDRVRVNSGQPQVYGTQFWTAEGGTFGPRPLEDAEAVDERRARVGLGPFEEYRQRMLKLNEQAQQTRHKDEGQ